MCLFWCVVSVHRVGGGVGGWGLIPKRRHIFANSLPPLPLVRIGLGNQVLPDTLWTLGQRPKQEPGCVSSRHCHC